MSRRDDSFHSLRVMSSATGARLSTQPREYAETTLQANMSTVTVLDRIQSDQAMHVRRQARDFQQIELSEEYDKQYVWSVGDGMLLRSEEALFMVASSPHSLDLLRQKMPLSTTTRFIERLKIWEPVTPTTSVVRRRLGALVSPSEAVAMLRAVHQLLVSVFARGISEISKDRNSPDVFHSVSLLSTGRIRAERDFSDTHHGDYEYALSATIKVNLTSSMDVLLSNRLELLALPVKRTDTSYLDGVVVDGVRDTDELVTQARVVQTTGQIFTAVKNAKAVEMPLRVAGLAYMIVEQLRQAANQAIAK